MSDDAPVRRRGRLAPFVALAVAAALAGLFVVLAGADASSDETAESPLLDAPAPDATGELADGTQFDLARRKGSWVVLNFFTSTCVPCVQEHPELVRFVADQDRLGPAAADLYTIVYDETDRGTVAAFFADRGGDWPVVFDDDGSLAVAFGVSQVPETWIVDPFGVVRSRFIGRVTASGLGQQLQILREGGSG